MYIAKISLTNILKFYKKNFVNKNSIDVRLSRRYIFFNRKEKLNLFKEINIINLIHHCELVC